VIAALIIGAFTAWHLGLRAGAVAAAVSFAALIAASLVPGMSLTVYLLLGAWVAALYFLGPRLGPKLASRARPPGKPGEMPPAPDWRTEASKWALRARAGARAIWASRDSNRRDRR
jgi:hypothetical protein